MGGRRLPPATSHARYHNVCRRSAYKPPQQFQHNPLQLLDVVGSNSLTHDKLVTNGVPLPLQKGVQGTTDAVPLTVGIVVHNPCQAEALVHKV